MLTANQHYYLQNMGVAVWQSRTPLSGAKLSPLQAGPLQFDTAAASASAPCLVIVTDALSPAAQTLFDTIQAVVGLSAEKLAWAQLPKGSDVVETDLQQQVVAYGPQLIWLMGKSVSQVASGLTNIAIPVMTTPHPEDLLSSPLLKRTLWHDMLAIHARLLAL